MLLNVSDREFHTILAALRYWQHPDFGAVGSGEESNKARADALEAIRSIATNEGTFDGLCEGEIDQLCERINCTGSKCPTCGKIGNIVNECGCDPNNLPTIPRDLHALRLCLKEIEQFHSTAYPDCKGGCPGHEAMDAARAALAEPKPRDAVLSLAREKLDYVLGVIENCYGHDEETGERDDDAEPEFSGADIVEQVCDLENGVREAMDALKALEYAAY